MKQHAIKEYLEWRQWVMPKLLRERPIHRWLVFPHSFTDDIVKALISEWGLGTNDLLVDPFIGAGTTILAAKEAGVPATGFDLSPLAVMVSNVKTCNYSMRRIRAHWKSLSKHLRVYSPNGESGEYPDLIRKALPGKKLATFHAIQKNIKELQCSEAERAFFQVALVALLPKFSNAIATGGWLSWEANRRPTKDIPKLLTETIETMLTDLGDAKLPRRARWYAEAADARRLPVGDSECSAVITSPPYPNRHDYTRVFGVELMFDMLDWEQTRELRYQLFESHPEARPVRPTSDDYREPAFITRALAEISRKEDRERIIAMLHGYFLDLYLSLKEVYRILTPGGHAAFVVGNAQYSGVPLEVDRATAEIGEQCGLICEEIRLVRERGNSAQQMRRYGRHPSRECVVMLRRR